MANLLDTTLQASNLTNNETKLLSSSEDLPKDKPSLFDTLLKNSTEAINSNNSLEQSQVNKQANSSANNQINNQTQENLVQNSILKEEIANKNTNEIKNLATNSKPELILEQTEQQEQNKSIEKVDKNLQINSEIENSDTLLKKDSEDKTTIKSENISEKNISANIEKGIQNSKNSLLDRLILEVKNSSVEKNDVTSLVENSDKVVEKTIEFTNSLEESISELNNKNLSNQTKELVDKKVEQKVEIITTNTTIKEDGTVVETLQKESLIKDLATNIETKNIEVLSKDIAINTTLVDEKSVQNSIINSNEIEKNSVNLQNNLDISAIIIDEEIPEENIKILENIKTNSLENQDKNQKLSLMDQLIVANSKQENKEQKVPVENNLEQTTDNKQQKQVASNIYLAEQKNSLNSQLLFNKNEAINILEKGSSIDDIKNSANILDLDISEVEVENSVLKDITNTLKDVKTSDIEKLERKNILDYLLNEKNIRSLDVKNLITNSVEASKALFSNTLTIKEDTIIDVQANLAQSIQTKIIGAKQQVSSMMSDVARQMYENYKPPVTAFRMILNPVELGSISVLMKQNGVNGLTISMSVSSLATLDLLMENQNMLRTSLIKTFDENSNFNLDFSQGEDSSQRDSSNKQKREEKGSTTQDILRMKDENKDYEEKNDYM